MIGQCKLKEEIIELSDSEASCSPQKIKEVLTKKKQGNNKKNNSLREKKVENALKALQENWQPKSILCREKEKTVIRDFIKEGIDTGGSSNSLCKYSTYA